MLLLLLSSSVMSNSCDPVGCSPPGSSAHGISQAKILEWVAISFSRGSSWLGDQTWVSCIADRFFTVWATRETPFFIVVCICQSQSPSLSPHFPALVTVSLFSTSNMVLFWNCMTVLLVKDISDWLHSCVIHHNGRLCKLHREGNGVATEWRTKWHQCFGSLWEVEQMCLKIVERNVWDYFSFK